MKNILIFFTPIFEEVDQYTKIVQSIILNNDDKKIFIAECKGKNHLKNCISNYKAENYKCLICKEKLKKIIIQNDNIYKIQYENYRYENENFKNHNELKSLEYKEIPIGKAVHSAVISILKNHHYNISENYSLINSVIKTSKMTIDFLYDNKHLDFNEIYVFNGRVSHFNAVVEFSKHFKVKYFTFEMARDRQRFLLIKNATSHNKKIFKKELLNNWDQSDPARREKLGELFFSKKKSSKFRIVNYSASFKKELPLEIKSLNNVITFFGSSRNEYESLDGWENKFLSGDDEKIIRDVCENFKDINFIYRAHPNLKLRENAQTNEIEKLKNINNLLVIDQYSNLSSYELIKKSNKIIVFASTVGVEATFMCKPVISLGPSSYDFLDISYKPKNLLELKKLLYNRELKPRSKMDALKYGYFMLSRGNYLNKKVYEIDFSLNLFHKILIFCSKIFNIIKNYRFKDFIFYLSSLKDRRIRKNLINYLFNESH